MNFEFISTLDAGLWQEVNQKWALEKKAQVLRDVTASLKNRVTKDLYVILFPSPEKKTGTSLIVASFLPSLSKNPSTI